MLDVCCQKRTHLSYGLLSHLLLASASVSSKSLADFRVNGQRTKILIEISIKLKMVDLSLAIEATLTTNPDFLSSECLLCPGYVRVVHHTAPPSLW